MGGRRQAGLFALLGFLVLVWLGKEFANQKADRDNRPSFSTEKKPEPIISVDPEEFADFKKWISGYLSAHEAGAVSPELIARGLSIARERRAAMVLLMRKNPEQALRMMVPRAVRPHLPSEIQALLEIPLDAVAPYYVSVACGAETLTERILVIANQDHPAHTYGHRLTIGSKKNLPVHGFTLEGEAAMHESPIRQAEEGEPGKPDPSAEFPVQVNLGGRFHSFRNRSEARALEGIILAQERHPSPHLPGAPSPDDAGAPWPTPDPSAATNWTHGTKSVLMVRMAFANDPEDEEVMDLELLRRQQAVTEEFLARTSYGKLNLTTTFVTNVLRLTNPASTYTNRFRQLIRDSADLVQNTVTNTNHFDLFTIVTTDHFSYGGMAGLSENYSQLVQGTTDSRTASHEYGHNLGLSHANYWRSDSASPIGQDSLRGTNSLAKDVRDGEILEYGHYFSIMSAQNHSAMRDVVRPSFAAAEKVRVGWLTNGSWTNLTASAPGPIRLFALETGATNRLRGVRIDAATTEPERVGKTPWSPLGRRYWLNFRPSFTGGTAIGYLPYGAQIDWMGPVYGQNLDHLNYDLFGYNYDLAEGVILLDMTPQSRVDDPAYFDFQARTNTPSYWNLDNRDKADAVLLIGRTYSDPAGIHITPVGRGNDEDGEEYLDIEVVLGNPEWNRRPAGAFSGFLGAGEPETVAGASQELAVISSDPDGDDLAFHWEVGHPEPVPASLNVSSFSYAWPEPGVYTVRCTVSDKKGKTLSLQKQVRVRGASPAFSAKPAMLLGGGQDDSADQVLMLTGGRVLVLGSAGGPWPLPNGQTGAKGILMTAFGPDGQPNWGKALSGSGGQGLYDACALTDGGFALCGWISGTADFSVPGNPGPVRLGVNGEYRFFVAVAEADGSWRWARMLHDSEGLIPYTLSESSTGVLEVGGYLEEAVDLPSWGTVAPVEDSDAFLIGLDPSDGSIRRTWFSGRDGQEGTAARDDFLAWIRPGPDGTIYFDQRRRTAENPLLYDHEVARFNPDLIVDTEDRSTDPRIVWRARLEGPFRIAAMAGHPAPMGGDLLMAVSGEGSGTFRCPSGSEEAIPAGEHILRISKDDGSMTWIWSLPGGANNSITDVSVGEDGKIWVAAGFYGEISVAERVLQSAGSQDILVVQLSPEGEALDGWRAGGIHQDFLRTLVAGSDGTIHGVGDFSGSITLGFGEQATSYESRGLRDIFYVSVPPKSLAVLRPPEEIFIREGADFSMALDADGNPFGFRITGLPGGLDYDPMTGRITGTPSVAGTYRVQVQAENLAGVAESEWTLQVRAAAASLGPSERHAAGVVSSYSVRLDRAAGRIFDGSSLVDAEVYFSTPDATPSNYPQGLPDQLSYELRPVSVGSGRYSTDFAVWLPSYHGMSFYAGVGTLAGDLPTTDTNSNGLPDFLEISRAAGTTVTATSTEYALNPFTGRFAFAGSYRFNLNFTRMAGEDSGFYTASYDTGANYSGRFYLEGGQGDVSYHPGTREIRFAGNSFSFDTSGSGASKFTIRSKNQLSVAAFDFVTTDGSVRKVNAFTLNRSGNRYRANVILRDGDPSTPYVDYRDCHLEVTDPNDWNGDGIPDLTDPRPAPVLAKVADLGAQVGVNFRHVIAASGSPASYEVGNLPPGLACDAASGVIHGRPQTAGIYPLNFRAVHAEGEGSQTVRLTVLPEFTGGDYFAGAAGRPMNFVVAAGGGTGLPPLQYSARNLPRGLRIDARSGRVTGSPATAGVSSNVVVVMSSGSARAERLVTVDVAPLTGGVSLLLGRQALSDRNLGMALTEFSEAVRREGTNTAARVYRALTAMALLQQNPAGNAFLDKLWVIPAISVWDATSGEAGRGYRLDARAEARGSYEPKNRAVSSGEVIRVLRTQHLPVELAVEADLAAVTDEAFRLTLPQDETGRPDVTLDYGDVLLLRAALAAKRAAAYLLSMHNYDMSVAGWDRVVALDGVARKVTFENIFKTFPSLLRLANRADGPLCRAEMEKAMDLYLQASTWVRTNRPEDRITLFRLSETDRAKEEEIRGLIAGGSAPGAWRAALRGEAEVVSGQWINGDVFFRGLDARALQPGWAVNRVKQGTLRDGSWGGLFPRWSTASVEGWLWDQTEKATELVWDEGAGEWVEVGTGRDVRPYGFGLSPSLPVVTNGDVVGQVGVEMDWRVTTTGGGSGVGYEVTGLPGGFSLDRLTGRIGGTPLVAGQFPSVVLKAVGPVGQNAKTIRLTILPAFTSTNRVVGFVNDAGFRHAVTVSTNNFGANLKFSASGLPTGLKISAATGEITGRPSVAGSFPATVTITALGASATQRVDFTIHGAAGGAFSLTLNPRPTNVLNLPVGLTYAPRTGVISGRPQGWGSFTATGQLSNGTTTNITIPVMPSVPVIAGPTNWTAQVGQAASYQIVAGGFGREWAGFDDFSTNTAKWRKSPKDMENLDLWPRANALIASNGTLQYLCRSNDRVYWSYLLWNRDLPLSANWLALARAKISTNLILDGSEVRVGLRVAKVERVARNFLEGNLSRSLAESNRVTFSQPEGGGAAEAATEEARIGFRNDSASGRIFFEATTSDPDSSLAILGTNEIRSLGLVSSNSIRLAVGGLAQWNLVAPEEAYLDGFFLLPDPDDIEYRAFLVGTNTLPEGLEVDGRTGLLAGVIPTNVPGGIYQIRVEAEYRTNNLPVQGLPILKGSTNVALTLLPRFTDPSGTVTGWADDFHHRVGLSEHGFGASLKFSATGLPRGLKLDSLTGEITIQGSGPAPGIYTSTVTIQANGRQARRPLELHIAKTATALQAPSGIFLWGDPVELRGARISSWRLATNAPSWLSVEEGTGRLYGTPPPETEGSFSLQLVGEDDLGNPVEKNISLNLFAPSQLAASELATPPGPDTSIRVRVTGLPAGATARVAVWANFDGNDSIGGEDSLLACFDVVDGQDYKIGGVRNTNRPWDRDGLRNGNLEIELAQGLSNWLNRITGDFIVEVWDPAGKFRATHRYQIALEDAGQEIHGTLRDDAGSPVPRAAVILENMDSIETVVAITDGSGNWRAPLPPGDYAVGYEPLGGPYYARPKPGQGVVSLSPGESVRFDGVAVRVTEPRVVQGRLVDTQGRPLRGTLFCLRDEKNLYKVQSFTGKEGEFRVVVGPGRWLFEPGESWLPMQGLVGLAKSRALPGAWVDTRTGSWLNLTVSCATPANSMLYGQVRGEDDRSLKGARVYLGWQSGYLGDFEVDSAGNFCFAALAGPGWLGVSFETANRLGLVGREDFEVEFPGPGRAKNEGTVRWEVGQWKLRYRFLDLDRDPVPNMGIRVETRSGQAVARTPTRADGSFSAWVKQDSTYSISQRGDWDYPPTHVFQPLTLSLGKTNRAILPVVDVDCHPLNQTIRVVPIDGISGENLSGPDLARALTPNLWVMADAEDTLGQWRRMLDFPVHGGAETFEIPAGTLGTNRTSWYFSYGGAEAVEAGLIGAYQSEQMSESASGTVRTNYLSVRQVGQSASFKVRYLNTLGQPVRAEWVGYGTWLWSDFRKDSEGKISAGAYYTGGTETDADGHVILPAFSAENEWEFTDWDLVSVGMPVAYAKPAGLNTPVTLRRKDGLLPQITGVTLQNPVPGGRLRVMGTHLDLVGPGYSAVHLFEEAPSRTTGIRLPVLARGANFLDVGIPSHVPPGTNYQIQLMSRSSQDFWSRSLPPIRSGIFSISGLPELSWRRQGGLLILEGAWLVAGDYNFPAVPWLESLESPLTRHELPLVGVLGTHQAMFDLGDVPPGDYRVRIYDKGFWVIREDLGTIRLP